MQDWVFRGKVVQVIDHQSVSVSLDLGFSVKKKHDFLLTGYNVSSGLEEEAKQCLVLLLGGHKVFLRSVKQKGREGAVVWMARIFSFEAINWKGVSDVIFDRRLPEIGKIMKEMEQYKFDSNRIFKVKTGEISGEATHIS